MDVKDKRTNELEDIYREMDAEGKEKMISAANKLLRIQRSFRNPKETQRYNSKTMLLYIALALVVAGAIWFFWGIFINPALNESEATLLIKIRILVTAFTGIFCVFSGFLGFLLQRIRLYWLFMLIIAGLACLDPQLLTDFIGFSFLSFIITLLITQKKRQKAAFSA